MSKSYIKDIFNEHWDDYQLNAVSVQYGGNKRFFEFIKTYDIHLLTINEKYKHKSAKYINKRLEAQLDGKNFTELPPTKNWNETLVRAQSKVIGVVENAESKIIQMSDQIDKKIEEKGWKDKIGGFINKTVLRKNSKKEEGLTGGEDHKEQSPYTH